jgi:fumarate reductase flavoprotein subunit
MRRLRTDILILGAGGAGLLAALHAQQAAPELSITIACKGLLGKSGCTRMVQGGYNVALAADDSIERHFMDTIEGGKWLPDQDLAWTLVNGAVDRIHELENRWGCFFDRNADGSLHQKAFAGQSFDRTVHKGDLTGIEIINRLAEQVWARGVGRLEEHRAIELVRERNGRQLAGVLLIDVRSGEPVFVEARAVLLATGGGPAMYRYHTPSGDKSCDGLAMALRCGLTLRDLEMVQFHPTGLLAGADTRMNGTVLEEGLRGAGGYLKNATGERFMARHDARGERATRDIVSRAIFAEMLAGNTSPHGGVYLEMGHLGAERVRRQFKGMVERCADSGFDLAGDRVEVVPTAHYMMGGLRFARDCSSELPGLFAAGEDTGGVHGANRLGGNGVANSTVFGGIAGATMAGFVRAGADFHAPDEDAIEAALARAHLPVGHSGGSLNDIRERLLTTMWDKVGIFRQRAGLESAQADLHELDSRLDRCGIGSASLAFHTGWHDWLNLKNLIGVSQAITSAALARENSLGAHWREDFPVPAADADAAFICLRQSNGRLDVSRHAVAFTRVRPGHSLLGEYV